jgi:hypothetical protein
VLIAGSLLKDSLKMMIWTGAVTPYKDRMAGECLRLPLPALLLHLPLLPARSNRLAPAGLGTIRVPWNAIGLSVLIGGFILGRVPEMLSGKYACRGDR